MRLLQKSTVSQSCLQDSLDFAERMKRKALRVRSEGSIPPYVTEAESRKQHSDSPLCNSLINNEIIYLSIFLVYRCVWLLKNSITMRHPWLGKVDAGSLQ